MRKQHKDATIQQDTGTKQPGIECILKDSTFGFPARGVRYSVNVPGESIPIQWGQTDGRGTFRVSRAKGLQGEFAVQYFDASSRLLASAKIDPRERSHSITLPFESWRTYKRVPDEETPPPTTYYVVYRTMVEDLVRRASQYGISVGIAANRCLQAAYELDYLTRIVDRILRFEVGAIGELASLLKRRRPRVIKPLDKGAAVVAMRGPVQNQPPDDPSFGPGMGDLFGLTLELGARHPGLGRLLLDTLFDLNRNVTPVVRSSRMLGRGPDRGGLLPGDPEIPLELTDRYSDYPTTSPFPTDPNVTDYTGIDGAGSLDPHGVGGRQSVLGDPTEFPDHPSQADKVLIRCETALSKTFDTMRQEETRGGSDAAITINAITPNHEPQEGSRLVRLSIIASRPRLITDTKKTSVPVSFPTLAGRVEVTGTVVSKSPITPHDWLYEIDVSAPPGTTEGVVQVLGQPRECTNSSPIYDPKMRELLDAVAACTGIGQYGGQIVPMPVDPHATVSAGQPGVGFAATVLRPTCSAVQPNWLGGIPEIHFRWVELDGAILDGDVWRCGALCSLQHESVLMLLEADEPLNFQCLVTNNPTTATTFKLSPVQASVGGPTSYLVAGTLYHVNWSDVTVVPAAAWSDLGTIPEIAEQAGRFVPITLDWTTLGPPIATPRIQILRASASNNLPGVSRRGLEVLRYLRPARVENIEITPTDDSKEFVNILVNVAMPTFATLGVSVIVQVQIGGDTVGSSARQLDSKDTQTFTFDGVEFQDHAQDGQATVTASVTYSYTDAGAFPTGVALGEQAGNPKSVSFFLRPKGQNCFLHGEFHPWASGHRAANAYLLALVSQYSYEGDGDADERKRKRTLEHVFGFDTVEYFSQYSALLASHAVVLRNSSVNVVSFRGTNPWWLANWTTNLDAAQTQLTPYIWVHNGFWDALTAIYSDVTGALGSPPLSAPLWLTGHSLGAALATLCAYRLLEDGYRVQGVYNYGSPRVGNFVFQQHMDDRCWPIQRWVDELDPVPRLPPEPPLGPYAHVGQMNHIRKQLHGSTIEFNSKVGLGSLPDFAKVSDHSMKRYALRIFCNLSTDLQQLLPDPPPPDNPEETCSS